MFYATGLIIGTEFERPEWAFTAYRQYQLMAQSDRLAKAPQSSLPDVVGIYNVIGRLSLEPDRHFLGLTGLWRFYEKAVGSACWNVRFQLFRTVTIDTLLTLVDLVRRRSSRQLSF